MKFTIICNILLVLLCYKLFGNWEIPIHLGFDPFRVVGGFPTLSESLFENIFEKASENSRTLNLPLDDLQYPVVNVKETRSLNWSCPILWSPDECISVVTSSECLPTSQFSFSFWEHEDDFVECLDKSKGNIDCKEPFQNGNVCENVVIGIRKSGENMLFFELEDVPINTQIIQTYGEVNKVRFDNEKTDNSTEEILHSASNYCQNYSIYETVLVGEFNDTSVFPSLPFSVNSTMTLKDTTCSSPFPLDVFICNCRNSPVCRVPVLYLTPNSTFCGSTTISFYHSHGFIYSVTVTSSSESSNETQQHTVLFFDIPQSNPRSKFDLQRGRFHCPSETSCIKEILYPFSYLNSLEIPYQMGILVFSIVLGFVILLKSNE